MGKESDAFGEYASLKTAKDGYKYSSHTAVVGQNLIKFRMREHSGGFRSYGEKWLRSWTPVGEGHFKVRLGEHLPTVLQSIDFRYTRGAWEFTADGRTYRQGLDMGQDLFDSLFSLCTIL